MAKRLPDDIREMVRTLHSNGHSETEIAKRLIICRSTVADIIMPPALKLIKAEERQRGYFWEKHINAYKSKEKETFDIWEQLKQARQIRINKQICDVVQVTEHNLTYRKENNLRYSVSRRDLYDNPKLVEVILSEQN